MIENIESPGSINSFRENNPGLAEGEALSAYSTELAAYREFVLGIGATASTVEKVTVSEEAA